MYGYGPSFSYGDVNPCGNTCEQRGLVCSIPNTYTQWGPRCECENGYLRTISGKCVAYDDPECVVEYAPSTGTKKTLVLDLKLNSNLNCLI